MVRIRFEMMVVMMRKVRKDKFKADFDDNQGDNDAEVSFDIDLPN